MWKGVKNVTRPVTPMWWEWSEMVIEAVRPRKVLVRDPTWEGNPWHSGELGQCWHSELQNRKKAVSTWYRTRRPTLLGYHVFKQFRVVHTHVLAIGTISYSICPPGSQPLANGVSRGRSCSPVIRVSCPTGYQCTYAPALNTFICCTNPGVVGTIGNIGTGGITGISGVGINGVSGVGGNIGTSGTSGLNTFGTYL